MTMFTICVCVCVCGRLGRSCSHLQCMFYDIMYAEIHYLLRFLLQISLCMFHYLMYDVVYYLCFVPIYIMYVLQVKNTLDGMITRLHDIQWVAKYTRTAVSGWLNSMISCSTIGPFAVLMWDLSPRTIYWNDTQTYV